MLKTLIGQIKEYKTPSLLSPLFSTLEVIAGILVPYLMSFIIDRGIEKGDLNAIYYYGGLMLCMAIMGLVFGVLAGKFAADASTGFACNLRDAMFTNIQTFSFSNIDKYSTAGLITRLTTDVTNLQMAYMMLIRMCIRAPVMLVSALVMAYLISPRLSTVFVAAIVFLAVALGIIIARATKLFRKVFQKYDDLNASVQENVSAIRVVKAFVREAYENAKFQKAADNVYHLFVKAEGNIALNSPVMMAAVYGCILGLSWFGAQMIVASGNQAALGLTAGNLTSLFAYVMNILMSLMILSMVFVMLSMSSASARRINEVLTEQPDLASPALPDFVIPDGSVDFDHVSFSYKGGSGIPVLRDVDLHIRSGETIGIIGGTGSSKSSLVSLISRLYDVTDGAVRVGGKDVRAYDLETLRREVAVVLQKDVLFSGTILENLRWGNETASLEDCQRACRLACADEFIRQMPNGYDTYIEQGGTNVSGGQKQRLCIARALLKEPKVLILDDSTSAVDTATDAKIRTAFRDAIPGVTKFVISQRISSIQDADRIVVLEDGQVNAFGTHQELLDSCRIYQEICAVQAQGNGNFDEEGGEA